MEKEKLLVMIAISGLVAGFNAQGAETRDGYAECKGIAPSGANNCGAHDHACNGYAKTDWDPEEWVWVETANCATVQNIMRNPIMRKYVKEVAVNAFKYWRRAPIPE